ncbi:MAG: hypothetical protein JJU02_11595 [Cryomorphaceae bacterium]|nr:hypothetical protein [Cryomorphaceae bacterium]
MIEKLINWLNSLRLSKTFTLNKTGIPRNFEKGEKIARTIYSPINIHKKKETINPNLFRPPGGKSVISVNRLSFTTPHFVKALSKQGEDIGRQRNYFGFAILNAEQISDFELIYSPLKGNPFHADIDIGFEVVKGEPLPAEVSSKIRRLMVKARTYKDPEPAALMWTGKDLI